MPSPPRHPRSFVLAAGLAVAAVHSTMASAAPTFSEEQVWADLLATLDTDGSGSVSQSEYAQRGDARHFPDLDRDQDGAVTAEELAEWVRLTPPRPEQPALLSPTDAATEAPGSVPPPRPPPVQAATQAPPPASTPAPTVAPAATPAPKPSPASSPSPLQVVAIAGLLVGVLTLGVGLFVRSRGGRRRRRRR